MSVRVWYIGAVCININTPGILENSKGDVEIVIMNLESVEDNFMCGLLGNYMGNRVHDSAFPSIVYFPFSVYQKIVNILHGFDFQ